ncbi:uncharacterized protein LOC141673822 [Apium graveolens]|uniref:uncharacterized protein LOC141673822 n=1 Tax=Apium graveolens TaxID=4045 RepID=UPI003D7ACFAA
MKRNQLSGHQKRQKKLKAAEAEKLQMGSLDKFFGKKTTNSGDIGVPIENTDIRKEYENEATYTEFEQETETEEPETQNLKDGLVENNVQENEKEISDVSINYDPEDGIDDWHNLAAKLRSHESSNGHLVNMSAWIELEVRMEKNETIDKIEQDRIKKEIERWKKVLVRIIVVVQTLACNNLAFRGDEEKIGKRKNGLFCKFIEMLAQFDPIMEEHIGKFRETGYDSCKKEVKELALELDMEPVFPEKRKIHRLVHFDDLGVTAADDDQNLSAEQKFRRYYFLYIVDQGAFQLKERFKQFQDYKEKFGFLFNLKKHLSGDDEGLKSCCMKLEGFLRHDMRYDIVGAELFNELLVLRMVIPDEITKAIDVLNYLSSSSSKINYPNAWIAYRIIMTIPVTVVEAEMTFSRLKLIKSYLRSSMSQDRLNGLALLSIESDLEIIAGG